MKKTSIIICIAIFALYACNSGGSTASGKVDYKMLENPEEIKRLFAEAEEKLGKHKNVTDEVRFSIDRPSVDGFIKRAGVPDNLRMSISYQKEGSKNEMYTLNYDSEHSGWGKTVLKEIQAFGPGKEDYRIEEDVFDFGKVSADKVNKVIADALARFKDPQKYKDQYVQLVNLNEGGIEVTVHNRLVVNEQEKSEYYRTDMDGKVRE